ncbi:MAG: 1-deoxy-D-xylulose-5-phosphate reductoisomerase [Helicobacter sp.]|nr:1-deoxy-D-xylulose-5-phosphate reductoisomerase [Helicobacter sp.]
MFGLLGSTGFIGKRALKIAKKFDIQVELLSCNKNISLLNEQIDEFSPAFVVIGKEADLSALQPKNSKVFIGQDGLKEALNLCKSKLILNAIVGLHGLLPSLWCKEFNKTLALANKESLVMAGWLFKDQDIIPIDSEHFSLSYLLKDGDFEKLIITSSGGALRDMSLNELKNASKKQVLAHPNWQMGEKITLDSATMVNKLFEILECWHLFGTKNIGILIERSSKVHAMIQHKDGSINAHISTPDMSLPISYALDPINSANAQVLKPLSLEELCDINFCQIDLKRYPLFELKDDLLSEPKLGVILNVANDFLNARFLDQSICFGDITEGIFAAFDKFSSLPKLDTLDEIMSFRIDIENFLKERF